MEPPSAPAHRGLVPWKGLLLATSLLTLWSLPTTAQLTIESVPPNAAEGKDVLLRVHNLPGDLFGYAWYKGESVDSSRQIGSYTIDTQTTTLGPESSGRETIYPNGSLLFQNVTLKDTGYYTLQATVKDLQNKQVTGQLHVYPELPKPNITSNNSTPEEHKDPVVLTCEPQTQDTTYLWLINSQSLLVSSRLQLSKDNRTLTLLLVIRKDTGPYEYETRNPELFKPNITANDTGSYTCLTHNSVTGFNRTTIKTITVYEPVGKPVLRASNATVTEHKDAVVLTYLTNDTGISIQWLFKNQNLLLTYRMKLSQDNSTLTIDPVKREDAGGYQCEVFNPVSSGISDPFGLNVQCK
ncbi:Carcinoembryonic antigen-related cell adhesion molecule 1 [Myotis davidii]|uniref:Carcinoembryonic antigen-related cell adhesion molecule 1 n=1 Tax=Myotis davidii TaxID=225400 RepID=L5LRT5_MYODS|nr:Carcinoembryonic antigen-related cell adhesion molecule 1 [Myotis davidii]